MNDKDGYPAFLDDMGKLLQAAMPRTDRERDELYAAEAEVRRLKAQLAVAEERQELARERYDRERTVLREMFDTWKSEVMSLSSGDDDAAGINGLSQGGTLVGAIPELPTASLTVER